MCRRASHFLFMDTAAGGQGTACRVRRGEQGCVRRSLGGGCVAGAAEQIGLGTLPPGGSVHEQEVRGTPPPPPPPSVAAALARVPACPATATMFVAASRPPSLPGRHHLLEQIGHVASGPPASRQCYTRHQAK